MPPLAPMIVVCSLARVYTYEAPIRLSQRVRVRYGSDTRIAAVSRFPDLKKMKLNLIRLEHGGDTSGIRKEPSGTNPNPRLPHSVYPFIAHRVDRARTRRRRPESSRRRRIRATAARNRGAAARNRAAAAGFEPPPPGFEAPPPGFAPLRSRRQHQGPR